MQSDLHTEQQPSSGYRVGTRTDVGLKRKRNEDYLAVEQMPGGLLMVVCDGMGGHLGGERASRLAIETITRIVRDGTGDSSKMLRHGVENANRMVLEESQGSPELTGMGTTLVGALLRASQATVVNVGDSRAYLYRNGRLSRVTRDHSLVGDLVAHGKITEQQAQVHPQRNVITRALGTASTVEPDLFELTLQEGDSLLLSSDGLHGMIDDNAIASILGSAASPEATVDALVNAALDAGGDDNVTVALLRYGSDIESVAGPVTDPPGMQSADRIARTTIPVAAATPVVEQPAPPPHEHRGFPWVWVVGAFLVAVGIWFLLVARPWETADNLAPNDSSFSIDVDSLGARDTSGIDSVEQLTPSDEVRDTFYIEPGPYPTGRPGDSTAATARETNGRDTLRRAPFWRDSMKREPPVTGGGPVRRQQQQGKR